jgi:hypothetical protein
MGRKAMNLIKKIEAGQPSKIKPASKAPSKVLTEILAANGRICKVAPMKLADIFRVCLIATVVMVVAIPMIQGA